MYYIGLDVHKKTISYCVKDASGQVHREGTIVCFFVGNDLTDPPVADFSAWYASTTVFVLVVALALTGYAFQTAVAGRPLIKAGFLDPD